MNSPQKPGARPVVKFEELRANFSAPPNDFAPFMFWFWDAPLDPAREAETARVLMQQGFSPGYIHSRKTAPDLKPVVYEGDDYLSKRWFQTFDAVVRECEKNGYPVAYCDDYMWPCLQAKGRVVEAFPELRARHLRWKVIDLDADSEAPVLDCTFAVAVPAAGPVEPNLRHPEGHPSRLVAAGERILLPPGMSTFPAAGRPWRVYLFFEEAGERVNYLDLGVAPAFIEIALEPYARRFPELLGKTIVADFIDNEGEFGKCIPWSHDLVRSYAGQCGRDLRADLPLLLDEANDASHIPVRYRWFDTVTRLYRANFEALTDWHRPRGMFTTGHFWEEGLPAELRWVGDNIRMQGAFSLQGQDALGLVARDKPHQFTSAASVAEFEGNRFMCELMGAAASADITKRWGTFDPATIKQCSNAMFSHGVSHVIPHAHFVDQVLQGNLWTPDWGPVNPMFPWMRCWTDFVRRASYLNSHGHQVAPVLIYYPIDSLWVLSGYECFAPEYQPVEVEDFWNYPEDRASGRLINRIDRAYRQAIDDLHRHRVGCLAANADYLRRMTVEGAELALGPHRFSTLILPPLVVLPRAIAESLRQFAENGGHLIALGELPTGSPDAGMPDAEILEAMQSIRQSKGFVQAGPDGLAPLLQAGHAALSPCVAMETPEPVMGRQFRIDGRDFFWIANNSEAGVTGPARLRGVIGRVEVWNPESGEITPLASRPDGDGTLIDLHLDPLQAVFFCADPNRPSAELSTRPNPPSPRLLEGPWTLRFDPAAQPSIEHPVKPAFGEVTTTTKLVDWKDLGCPPHFSGTLDYETEIFCECEPLWQEIDLGLVCHVAEVTINGQPLGQRMWAPHRFRLDNSLKVGSNRLTVRVANLADNNYGEPRPSGLFGLVTLL